MASFQSSLRSHSVAIAKLSSLSSSPLLSSSSSTSPSYSISLRLSRTSSFLRWYLGPLRSSFLLVLVLFLVSSFAPPCTSHGRLTEPPSRASAWRFGFDTPENYDDNQLFCGGKVHQWEKNKGRFGDEQADRQTDR